VDSGFTTDVSMQSKLQTLCVFEGRSVIVRLSMSMNRPPSLPQFLIMALNAVKPPENPGAVAAGTGIVAQNGGSFQIVLSRDEFT